MSELEKLELERSEINKRINKIKEKEQDKENKRLAGKCFKVKNSLGMGDDWWLYTIVHGINNDGLLNITQFEIDTDGRTEIKQSDFFLPYSGYMEIPRKELLSAWEKLVVHVGDINHVIQGQ